MKPGRELDALVAEKVMGLECGIIAGNPKIKGSNCGTYGCTRHWIDTPEYSTDIAAAWEVVDKMQSLKKHFLMMQICDNGHVIASFYNGPNDKSITGEGDAAPEAICLAALKACGINF